MTRARVSRVSRVGRLVFATDVVAFGRRVVGSAMLVSRASDHHAEADTEKA